MENITLNNELTISFPEGFRRLSEAEMDKLTFIERGSTCCFQDDEKHMLVSLGYKTVRRIASMLLNNQDIAKASQIEVAKALKDYQYQLKGYEDCQIGTMMGRYFDFTYQAQETDMYSQCCVLKRGKEFYYLTIYAREAEKEEAVQIWEKLLKEAKWL